jgi:hypothetical protein
MIEVSIKFIVILFEVFVATTVAVLLLYVSLEKIKVVTFDLSGPSMLLSDWEKEPLIDVTAVAASEDCPNNFYPLFNQTWPGTVQGCLVDDVSVVT